MEDEAQEEATETTATADATKMRPTTETTDAATDRGPATEMQAGPIGIGIADETDQGHATGHIATPRHQETAAAVAIGRGMTLDALETVAAEMLPEAIGHHNTETVCLLRAPT